MAEEYNKMYDSLVSSDDDIIGLIAYGIYKRHKRKFIINHTKAHGIRPNDKEMENFMTSALSQLDRYKKEGQDIFLSSVGNAVQKEYEKSEEHKKLVDKVISAAQNEIGKIEKSYEGAVDKIVSKHSFRWYSTIGLNLVATVLFSLILGMGYFLLHTSEKGTKDTMEQLMGQTSDETKLPTDSAQVTK